MGALNLNIEYLTYSKKEHLKDFVCYGCRVFFNDKDLADSNFVLGVSDNANEIKKEGGTFLDQRQPFYSVVLCLKDATHKKCPEVERCEDCYSRFRTEEMRKYVKDDKWYCLKNCWRNKSELRRDAVEKPKRKRHHE